MRYLVGFAALLAVGAAASADPVRVDGHVRRDGTYVPPHVRTAPNNTTLDNWSTRPNVNPYNGREGTRSPNSTSNSGWGSTRGNRAF